VVQKVFEMTAKIPINTALCGKRHEQILSYSLHARACCQFWLLFWPKKHFTFDFTALLLPKTTLQIICAY